MLADDSELEGLLERDAVAFGFAREKRFGVSEFRRSQAVEIAARRGLAVSRDGIDVDPQWRVPVGGAPRLKNCAAATNSRT